MDKMLMLGEVVGLRRIRSDVEAWVLVVPDHLTTPVLE
jgi:hypothetical protein